MECPKCHYVRQASDTASPGECPKCGIIYSKFNPANAERLAAMRARHAPPSAAPAARSAMPAVGESEPKAAPAGNNKVTQCPACGGTVAYGINACPHCGQSKPAPRPKAAPKPVGKLGLTIAFGFLGFSIFVMAIGSNNSSGSGEQASNIDPRIYQEAPIAIRLAGYRCDSVDYVGKLLTKTGFKINCNGYRYAYTITDEGGRLVVRLD